MFIQVLDATVISTALPSMAHALGRDPVALNVAVTAYLLATAAFLPIGGWVADRFGAKRVLQGAIIAFALSSLLCGLSQNLPQLVAGRVLQGVAGSLLTPVGRIVLLKSIARRDIVWGVSYMTLPALLGPMLGPTVGGLIVTLASWRWIFFINLPLALAAVALIQKFVQPTPRESAPPPDVFGFVICGLGLACLIGGLGGLYPLSLDDDRGWGLLGLGALFLAVYVFHARRAAAPILDLRLLSERNFRAAVFGGAFGRLINGANPFLLALLLQLGFGMTPLAAGLVTFGSAAGALVMRALSPALIHWIGCRRVLVLNAFVCAAAFGAVSFLRPSTPVTTIVAVVVAGGAARALQFTGLNVLAYADVERSALSRASTLWSVAHQLTQSLGVAAAALIIGGFRASAAKLSWPDIAPAFATIALVSLVSVPIFLTAREPRGLARRRLATADRPG